MSDSPMSEDRPRIVKNTTEAREGVTGHNVRYVLITSVVGAAVILAGLWLYYFCLMRGSSHPASSRWER
jgi:hypothetical protein